MKLCFLTSSHGIRAAKTFSDKVVTSYPQIKSFDSDCYELALTIEGLQRKENLLRQHAHRGSCQLKGVLNKDLKKESRKGAVTKEHPTQNIVFDIDGALFPNIVLRQPLTEAKLIQAAEHIVALLPAEFHSVSYIVHASSSFGMKQNRISLHLDFWLTTPVSPAALKYFLTALNFEIPQFDQQIALSASGTALSYRLDPCLADNSRLIYIATPEFKAGAKDPFEAQRDRIALVPKQQVSVELNPLLTPERSFARVKRMATRKLAELRATAGLPDKKAKTAMVPFQGTKIETVANPDRIHMRIYEDRGEWVTYNVNDGDSGGYYVNKYNPAIVFNFKNEPNFLFEQADPDAYAAHLKQFIFEAPANTDSKVKPPAIPIGFRDYSSNVIYNGLFDPGTRSMISISRTDRMGLNDFLLQYDVIPPDPIPTWDYVFRPDIDVQLDVQNRFLNRYTPGPVYTQTVTPPEGFEPLELRTCVKLDKWCPTIYTLLMHVVGGRVAEFEHFLNWLATAFQLREKLGTAWILHGVQGTGKGIVFERIIAPLIGSGVDQNSPYYIQLRQENIEDQFNSWEETALFAAIDEFKLSESKQSEKLFNKIKNMITEPTTTVRAMRENPRRVKTYTNYLIYANDEDMISIPADDRRFNVGVRQLSKLTELFPDTYALVHRLIPAELPLFAHVIRTFKCDLLAARTALDNDAKAAVREIGKTSIHEFVDAVKVGDLEYFLPILDMPYSPAGVDFVTPSKLILKKVLKDWTDDEKIVSQLSIDQLRMFYTCLIGRIDSANKFARLLARYGVQTERYQIGGVRKRGLEIVWVLRHNTIEQLQDAYCHDMAPSFTERVVPLKREISHVS